MLRIWLRFAAAICLMLFVGGTPVKQNVFAAGEAKSSSHWREVVFLLYHNPKYGISIRYPRGWKVTVDRYLPGVMFKSAPAKLTPGPLSDTYPAIVHLSIEPARKSLDGYRDIYIEARKSMKATYNSVTVLESSHTILAHNSAGKLVLLSVGTTVRVKSLDVWTIENGKVYDLTYTIGDKNYDQYLSAVQHMIDSFEIK